MPRRAQKWIIHEDGKTWSLFKGGRPFYEGMRSEGEAIGRLKQHYVSGEAVVLEEEDGYRTNITADLKKRGVI